MLFRPNGLPMTRKRCVLAAGRKRFAREIPELSVAQRLPVSKTGQRPLSKKAPSTYTARQFFPARRTDARRSRRDSGLFAIAVRIDLVEGPGLWPALAFRNFRIIVARADPTFRATNKFVRAAQVPTVARVYVPPNCRRPPWARF